VVVAGLVLIYTAMHAASALRSFHFFQRIERLELEARRLVAVLGEGPNSASTRKQVVTDVTALRHNGEIKAYIDLLFLAIVMLLCIAKIVTN
jgi:hypothetical protein